jgi:DNA ligase (NAD+)
MDAKKMKHVDTSLPIKDRIAFLKYCADLYETNGTSPISDAEWDKEYYELEIIAPNDPFFEQVGGMSDEHIYGTQVKHDVVMGSLNKSLDIPSFDKWLRSTYSKPASFVLEYKIDGLSLGLLYENGKLVRATTRGDGTIGIDVTKTATYVNGVLTHIPYKGRVEVRGECFKDRHDFYKNWYGKSSKSGTPYKHPRNFASGSLNQIDPKVTKERGLDFVAYEVVQKEFYTEVDKNRFLVQQGFPTLKDSTKRTKDNLTFDQIVKAVKRYMDRIDKATLPFMIDGIVVKLNDIKSAKKMGTTAGGRKPKSNRAVKFPPLQAETILEDVVTNVGRTGNLTPVAVLKPVDLDGAMITRATLHNYSALVGKDAIKIGAKVVIVKKGDIIPQIVEVKQNGTQDIKIPDTCPSCGEPVGWDSNKVEIICTNSNCLAQLVRKIVHWFDKIGVKGVKGKTLGRLTDKTDLEWEGHAIIESLPEVYYMLDNDRRSEHPFRKYNYLKEQFGEKMYNNILESIKSVDEVPLAKFIEALGIGKIGRTAADIIAIAPTINDIDQLTVDQVASIPGFGDKKAQGFIDGWKAQRDEIETLLKYVKVKVDTKSSDKLTGKTFCFTGSFSKPRKELQEEVVKNGGKASSSVGKDTILVWDGEEQGNKYNKAIANNNTIISEEEFTKMFQT